jgi:hypothetical protein
VVRSVDTIPPGGIQQVIDFPPLIQRGWAPPEAAICFRGEPPGNRSTNRVEIVDVRDMRVIERGQDLGLTPKSGDTIRIVREGRRQDLQGDVPAESGVFRSIDLPHAAGTERSQDLVSSEPGAGVERHLGCPVWIIRGGGTRGTTAVASKLSGRDASERDGASAVAGPLSEVANGSERKRPNGERRVRLDGPHGEAQRHMGRCPPCGRESEMTIGSGNRRSSQLPKASARLFCR